MRVENLAEGVEGFTANCFLVRGERVGLVDPGPVPGLAERVASRVDRLDLVVATHLHRDHVANLAPVVERFDPEVLCNREHPLRTREIGTGDAVELGDGRFDVLRVPGHTDDHVVLCGDDAAFTGDVVVYSDSAFEGGSFGRTDAAEGSREKLIAGLERLLDRLPRSAGRMYPGHGPVHDGDVASVVETALRRARGREPKYG